MLKCQGILFTTIISASIFCQNHLALPRFMSDIPVQTAKNRPRRIMGFPTIMQSEVSIFEQSISIIGQVSENVLKI